MKITQKRLKEIIKEEMQRLDEGFGRHMAGETERTATAMQDSEAGQIWLELSGALYKAARGDLSEAGNLRTAIRGLGHEAKEAIRQELAPRGGRRNDSEFPEGKYGYTDTPSQPFQESKKTKKRK
tara:strand:- start:179 stop:553 length:375 start_codon:yes stop_codon:yes gene_type:complete